MDTWLKQYAVDLHNGTVRALLQGPQKLLQGAANALRVDVTVTKSGAAVDLTGWTISAEFRRQDGVRVLVEGTASGNIVSVVMEKGSADVQGRLVCDVWATREQDKIPLVRAEWEVLASGEGPVLDVSGVIPSLEDLLMEVETLREATAAANAAAESANLAVNSANVIVQVVVDKLNNHEFDGADGADGADGLSAYQVAQQNGFTGTETEWLASLKGQKGDTGNTGPAGADGIGVPSVTAADNGKVAGVVNGQWAVVEAAGGGSGEHGPPGADGLSAYEIAVQNGFVGDETAWLASLVGPKGDTGPTGPAGQDGDTPEKGVDYFTASDKAEIVSEAVTQTTAQMANVYQKKVTASTTDLTAGTSALATGEVYLVYE